MEANNGSGNNEGRDSWQTPQELFNTLNEQYRFITDCCANKENTKCKFYHYHFEQAKYINCPAWMNPPFSKAKAMFAHFFKVVDRGVAIYRCDNLETALWQEIIFKEADWIFIPNKRVSYEGFDGSGSRFPSALIGIGVEPPKNLKGTTLRIIYQIKQK